MLHILAFMICFLASAVGALCGIGGGVIIKPLFDAIGMMDVSAVSFLSGCTVLAMTAYSVLRSMRGGASRIRRKTSFPLAVGAALGGMAGKYLFQIVEDGSKDPGEIGLIQAVCLFLVTAGTLFYTVKKDGIRTKRVEHMLVCILIGLVLGMLSSFLGIGGGPVNLVVLFYFFSMDTKTAAENSLYIILFSQIAGLSLTVFSGAAPDFSAGMLLSMAAGGIAGGAAGRKVNCRIEETVLNRLFLGVMVFLLGINLYNIRKFL